MAEALPNKEIEAKIKQLVQIQDGSQKSTTAKSEGASDAYRNCQKARHSNKSEDSLDLDDEAVISYSRVGNRSVQVQQHRISPEHKQAGLQSSVPKKRSRRKNRNRAKKQEAGENAELEGGTNSRQENRTDDKASINNDRKAKEEEKGQTGQADDKDNLDKSTELTVASCTNNDSKVNLNDGGERNVNKMETANKSATTDENLCPANQKTKLEAVLNEQFVFAQNLYYKKEIIKDLEKDGLFLLKKKSSKFPTARFFCRLCEYHCFDLDHCEAHRTENRHKRLMKIRLLDELLKNLPPPEPAHIRAVRESIERIYRDQHLNDEHLKAREALRKKIQCLVGKQDVDLVMYGSSRSTLGIHSSDVNIDLNQMPPLCLKDAYLKLKENESTKANFVQDVESDLTAKVPCVRFTVRGETLRCQLSINNTCSHQTAELLYTYSRIDLRLTKLAVTFRYLGKLCKMDKQEEGSLPSYVFYLMTVFFLQQCEPPVLPVLHEIKGRRDGDQEAEEWYFKDVDRLSEYWTSLNNCCVGELWIQMLRFYCIDFDLGLYVISIRQRRPLTRQEKKWTSKKLAIEDPFMRRRNVASGVSHSQVFEYIIEQFKVAYKYFGIPQLKNGPLFDNLTGLAEYKNRYVKAGTPSQQAAKTDGCNNADRTSHEARAVADTNNTAKGLKSMKQSDIKSFIAELLNDLTVRAVVPSLPDQCSASMPKAGTTPDVSPVSAIGHASCPHSSTLSDTQVTHGKSCDDSLPGGNSAAEMAACQRTHSTESVHDDRRSTVSNTAAESERMQEDVSGEVNAEVVISEDGLSKSTAGVMDSVTDVGRTSEDPDVSPISDIQGISTVDDVDASVQSDASNKDATGASCGNEHTANMLLTDEMVFLLNADSLSDPKGPAIMCSICQKEGHLKSSCPEENLLPLDPLPPLTKHYRAVLDQIVRNVPGDFMPTQWEMRIRHKIVCELEAAIQETYSGAKLQVFGSSCNGFGFRGSDLDICLTFTEKPSLASINPLSTIEQLAKLLKKQKTLYNVIPITTAKVPIVKFRHRQYQLEGDISLYNTLALENTRMLQLYSFIDKRVVYLGYMMKVLAKICDICDASRGSLSSYAYILMVIYFLQQRKPPVIPVLQELKPTSGKKHEKLIDGWNAWFFDDIRQLQRVWPDYGKNTESSADLWLGLLRFYTEEFNFKEYVISIRQKVPLTKFERLWNTSTIAIEDPFDLSHNLGAGLSRRMNMFIIRTLRNARKLFGTSVDQIPRGYNLLEDYLFDPRLLTDSLPPSDRNCHCCGKIGHFAKECPLAEIRKGEEEKRRQKQQQQRQQQQQQRAQQQQQRPQQQHQRTQQQQQQQKPQQQQGQMSQQQERQPQQQKDLEAIEQGEQNEADLQRLKPIHMPPAKQQMMYIKSSPDYPRSMGSNGQPIATFSTASKQQHPPVFVPPSLAQGLVAEAQQAHHAVPICQSMPQHQLAGRPLLLLQKTPSHAGGAPMLQMNMPPYPAVRLQFGSIGSNSIQQQPKPISFPPNQQSIHSKQQQSFVIRQQPMPSFGHQQLGNVSKEQAELPGNSQLCINLYEGATLQFGTGIQQANYNIKMNNSFDNQQLQQVGVNNHGSPNDVPQEQPHIRHKPFTNLPAGSEQPNILSCVQEGSTQPNSQQQQQQQNHPSNLQASSHQYSHPISIKPSNQQHLNPNTIQTSREQYLVAGILPLSHPSYIQPSNQQHLHPGNKQSTPSNCTPPANQAHIPVAHLSNDVCQLSSSVHSGHPNVPLDQNTERQQPNSPLDSDWPTLTGSSSASGTDPDQSQGKTSRKRGGRQGKVEVTNTRIFVNQKWMKFVPSSGS